MRFQRILFLVVVLNSTFVFAQHLEIGGFGNYDRQNQPHYAEHLFGLGARADFNIVRSLQFETEFAYDFKRTNFEVTQQPGALIVNASKLGIVHGNLGFKLQSKGGSFFLFLKGGANEYRTEARIDTVTPPLTVTSIRLPDRNFTKGILYPGGGVAFHAGPLGLRIDVGDEIYWNEGSNHSLRVTFGPTFRF